MPPNCSLFSPTEANLDHCADLLRSHALLAIPTETVYGLAGNALSPSCVQSIFRVKGRPLIDPLIVHCSSTDAAFKYLKTNPLIEKVAHQFWPGPLTIVANKQAIIPAIVTAGLDSVAIRVPQHPIFKQLLSRIDFPLAAPSANPFGYVSPTQAQHVQKTLGDKIAGILDGGPSSHGIESTILDLRDPEHPVILRQGPIPQKTMEGALAQKLPDQSMSLQADSAHIAPGQLLKHYSTHAAIQLFSKVPSHRIQAAKFDNKTACIFTHKPLASDLSPHIYWLSESGDLAEVAQNMFSLMQKLDQMGYQHLHIQLVENTGIGLAINDRLKRAAAQ